MELRQRPGKRQAYACSPVIGAPALVVKLIIPLENLLQLFFRNAFSGVGNRDFQISRGCRHQPERGRGLVCRDRIKRKRHLPSRRGELEGVGQQIVENLPELIGIYPRPQRLSTEGIDEFNALDVGIYLELGINLLHLGDHVGLGDPRL